ncbi:hypothetical protein ASH00_06200 [Arthrobacter sp. Soil782]|uniref:DUF427 domain-containing protein n=1 Tax=Arthrobacter sp. Soil782 TaxID=1736410 RepID=UPI0006F34ABD|nr:DUF427 domain-containing protein [Arthrobacter sp. Soil782]KRF09224.1 hypothetical protein ASH00_06200 [Arthrobacter sp. Soil782]
MGITRDQPGPGQESVWDYPRPPRVESYPGVVVLEFGGQEIARTQRAMRVLETSHPPVFYVPQADFAPGTLHRVEGTTWCEFKGAATYYDVVAGSERAERSAWTYLEPTAGFEQLSGTVAVYPGRMDRCLVDNEVVQAQPGDFYGGWITSKVVGPFKGPPGTWGW